MSVNPGSVFTRSKRQTRRNTKGRVAIAVFKSDTSGGQSVEIDRLYDIISVAAKDTCVVLIGHDYKYVRLLLDFFAMSEMALQHK